MKPLHAERCGRCGGSRKPTGRNCIVTKSRDSCVVKNLSKFVARRFGGKTWSFYRRVFFWSLVGVGFADHDYLLRTRFCPSFAANASAPSRIKSTLTGNHIVTTRRNSAAFPARPQPQRSANSSRCASQRRSRKFPGSNTRSIQRILPNRFRVEITERTPIAFFRNGAELALIDAHGVILDRPEGEDYHFPIVTGLSDNMPCDEREKRMKTYQEFMKAIDMVRSRILRPRQ